MKSPFIKLLVFWFSLATPLFASKSDVLKFYHLLKDLPKSEVAVKGQVCEKIAMLQMMNKYSPEDYSIVPNVTYGTGKILLGELDLLVVKKTDHKVMMVLEVKCRKDLRKSAKKAKEQLERIKSFTDVYGLLASSDESQMSVDGDVGADVGDDSDWYIHFEMEEAEGEDSPGYMPVFDLETRYLAISPLIKTRKSHGFLPLALSFEEVDLLTKMLNQQDEQDALRICKRY